MSSFRIGDLARATRTKVETIRWYEKQGLLPPPPRTEGNYRSYGEKDLERLGFIRRARDLGFPLDQIRALLALAEDDDADCGSIDVLTAAHLAVIDRKLADLTLLRRELSSLLSSCKGGKVATCQIVDALGPLGDGREVSYAGDPSSDGNRPLPPGQTVDAKKKGPRRPHATARPPGLT